jgi:hypothetical protein
MTARGFGPVSERWVFDTMQLLGVDADDTCSWVDHSLDMLTDSPLTSLSRWCTRWPDCGTSLCDTAAGGGVLSGVLSLFSETDCRVASSTGPRGLAGLSE